MPKLIDTLIPVADQLRTLHDNFGTRPYRVFVVVRSWTGNERGLGSYTDTETELLPVPDVVSMGNSYTLTPGGRQETGPISISEISLTYTIADLDPEVERNQEFMYCLRDNTTSGQSDTYFNLKSLTLDRIGLQYKLDLIERVG